jgi:hypothetical protein
MVEFIFMLTRDDRTIEDGVAVLESLQKSGLRYVGFKDVGASPSRQRELTETAHSFDMEVMLEVVSTSLDAEVESLESARNAGVDWVLGGTHPDLGVELLKGTDIKYCPFAGTVTGHPSALGGDIEAIAADAARMTALPGVHGLDLLTYRHATADREELTRAVVEASAGPIIAAGAVVRADQIALLARAGAWGFTVGTAVFDGSVEAGTDIDSRVRYLLDLAASS